MHERVRDDSSMRSRIKNIHGRGRLECSGDLGVPEAVWGGRLLYGAVRLGASRQ